MGKLGIPYRGALARTVLGIVAVSLIPWSAAAGDAKTSPQPPLQAALAVIRTRDVTAVPRSPAPPRRSDQSTNPALQSPSFFKTRLGVIVAAVTVAGAGYAIYSAQHDRIHSAGKK